MNHTDTYVNGQIGGSKSQMSARFFMDCVVDKDATEQAGRTMYKDALHVLLISDHGRRQIPKLATPELIKKYPNEHESFISRVELTPLIMIDLKPSQIRELEYHGIKSVEDFDTVECPEGFEKFAQIARLLNQHRESNELQSDRHNKDKRENLRIEEVRQVQDIGSGNRGQETSQKSQKESNQKITPLMDFSFQL